MLKKYFAAVWADWVARMSGIASIILAFLAAYFEFIVKHGKAVLWITAALCFIIASYRIWAKEHMAVLAAQARFSADDKDARKREYIIDGLRALIRDGVEAQKAIGLGYSKLENWGRLAHAEGFGPRAEHFLRQYLGESYVQRFKEKRLEALEEIVKELLDS